MDLSTYIVRVQDEINRTDMGGPAGSTTISLWLNEVRMDIADGTIPVLGRQTNTHRFGWLQASTSVNTSLAHNDWPSDFIEEISLLETSKEKPLVPIDPVYFDQLLYSETDGTYGLDTTGTPSNYIDRGTGYDLYPAPSGPTYLYLRYFSYPAELANASDEEEIDKQIPSFVLAATCLKFARYSHDKKLKDIYKEQVEEYYLKAIAKDRKKRWKNRQLRMKTYKDFDISHWKGMYQTGDP